MASAPVVSGFTVNQQSAAGRSPHRVRRRGHRHGVGAGCHRESRRPFLSWRLSLSIKVTVSESPGLTGNPCSQGDHQAVVGFVEPWLVGGFPAGT